jgi:hypothetical protein
MLKCNLSSKLFVLPIFSKFQISKFSVTDFDLLKLMQKFCEIDVAVR